VEAMTRHTRTGLALLALGALLALPLVARALGETYYISVASRVLIYGLAATSLNLILGFGGMVSFGHAAFVGAGAYTVGILAQEATRSAWLAWPAAVLASGLLALVIGAISLRTRGLYFIMITLAFAQMLYYFFVSLRSYGGDDGLSLPARSSLPFGLELRDDLVFYYTALAILGLALWLCRRLLRARFGQALRGIRENETRMEAVGYPVYRYKLAAFVIAGATAGLAGALLANQARFVSPTLLSWQLSGMLIVMVILGGVGTVAGPSVGAAVVLGLEEVLTASTQHWQLGLGLVLLLVVLRAPGGITGLVAGRTPG
jgi:branched-chain amino acid transport system permease protein